jgi:hypothetical protein
VSTTVESLKEEVQTEKAERKMTLDLKAKENKIQSKSSRLTILLLTQNVFFF